MSNQANVNVNANSTVEANVAPKKGSSLREVFSKAANFVSSTIDEASRVQQAKAVVKENITQRELLQKEALSVFNYSRTISELMSKADAQEQQDIQKALDETKAKFDIIFKR